MVVTGGAGFLGSPRCAMLEELGAEVRVPRSAEYDLRDRSPVARPLEGANVVIHLAANVGGIGYNLRNPAPLAHDNTRDGHQRLRVMPASRSRQARRGVLGLRLSEVHTPSRSREDELWDGYPEESNAPYGLAKRMLARPLRRLPAPVRLRLLRAGAREPLRAG